jgi:ABC-type sugar transport system substrate-binding protein
MMKQKTLSLLLVLCIMAIIFTACSGNEPAEAAASAAAGSPRQTYYYIAPGLGQPFSYDMHLGFKHAARYFNCEIIQQGGDDWNSTPAAQALEQIIPRNPAGIITVAWDPAMNPGIIKAQQAGIPIILVEAESGELGDLYIGLNNVDAGRETAELLLQYGGNSGKLLVIGNWGSTNIDQKFIGLKEVLTGTGWQIVGDQDSDADAETSLRAAKDLLNLHPDATAFVGLDSACGAGIATAMEELGMAPGSLTVICADREDAMLEFIKTGYISASLTNRTAMMCYLAVQFLESVTKYGFYDIPITADNKAAGISVYPKQVYTGNVVITRDNVNNFDHNQMDSYDTPLYH